MMLDTLAQGARVVNDSDEKLSAALAEVSRLNQRYDEIDASWRARVDTSFFQKKVQAAEQEYKRSQSCEDLERLVLNELILEKVEEKLRGLRRAYAYGGTVVFDEFAREFIDWRDKLVMVCKLCVEKTRATLQSVTAEERARLGSGFHDDEIESSPVVRRARKHLQHWENTLRSVQTATSWKMHVTTVLKAS